LIQEGFEVKRRVIVVILAVLLIGLIRLGLSCAPQATLEISGTALDNGVMIENVGNIDCLVLVHSAQGEHQVIPAISQEAAEEDLLERGFRVFSLVVYVLMGLAALIFLIISIRRYRLPKVVKTLGKVGLGSTVFFCAADLILVLMFVVIPGQDLSGTYWGLSAPQWLTVYAILGAAVLVPTVYVIKKTGFLEKFADQSLFVKILTVCISIFGLVAAGWGLWEGLLKHIPMIIVSIVLLAFVLFLFITGMGGLIKGLQEEYKTPREKLARDIARAIKEQEDEDYY